jgi:hypothetical protein
VNKKSRASLRTKPTRGRYRIVRAELLKRAPRK